MADYDEARRALESLGEDLDVLGYNAPMQTIEGNNVVGRAVRDCRSAREVKVIATYLKEIHGQFKKLPLNAENRDTALRLIEEAWEEFRAAMDDGVEVQINHNRPAQGDIARYSR